MHVDYLSSRETLRERLERDRLAIDALLADSSRTSLDELVLEQLPNGEHAWLRPESDRRRYVMPGRYWVTDAGRRALAEDALFGQPWPTVADVDKLATRAHYEALADEARASRLRPARLEVVDPCHAYHAALTEAPKP
jgi:hypothetical protein